MTFGYKFPHITNISNVLPAIAGRDEFVVADKGSYTVINYNVMMADTFPPVIQELLDAGHEQDDYARIRRECRGIIFDSKTGDIIRRPFHKFFNVNEREETQDHVIDLSRPHAILEKLDGSMIAPFIVNGQMIWGTKMGATDVAKPVEEFVKNNSRYHTFAYDMIYTGLTPIFEWCSRKQRIVLDYGTEDQLVLTAVRDMHTGEYISMDEFNGNSTGYIETFEYYNIPVVRAFEPQTDMKAFLDYVRDLEDLEGFVVRFDDGHMLKLKCDWYVQIHKAKEAILQDRNIVSLIVENLLDDIKSHLPSEDKIAIEEFENKINAAIIRRMDVILQIFDGIGNSDRKSFALGLANELDQFTKAAIFTCWDKRDANSVLSCIKNTILNNLSKTVKYEYIKSEWFPLVQYNSI